ncbi:MAG: 23S rRNA (guanosine(2251)-2'-O)-methyltransferase RlmB [Actinomycetota bacterium]
MGGVSRRPARGRKGANPGRRGGQRPGNRRGPADHRDGPPRRRPAPGLGGDQVEGRNAVRELLAVGRRHVHEVMVATDMDDSPIVAEIVDIAYDRRIKVTEVSKRRLDAEAISEAPQGVLALAAPLKPVEIEDLLEGSGTPFLLVLDGITDPGNLGAILRTAEGAGVSGVVMPRHRAARVTPTVAKAAAGAIEHLRIAQVGGLPAALQLLGERKVWRIGLHGPAKDRLFDLKVADEPVALVLGAEGKGVSRLVRERCDQLVSIPILGELESLNVAAAGALALYEVVRARS